MQDKSNGCTHIVRSVDDYPYEKMAEGGEASKVATAGSRKRDIHLSADRNVDTKMSHECVEVCPHCEGENILQWDVEKDGYIVKCGHCGDEIFLCDECMHQPFGGNCDWEETEYGGKCKRGKTYKKKQAKYIMEVTETQLKTINAALEEYMRIPLNQWSDLANRLAGKGVDFSKDNPRHSEIFDNYIIRRDAVLEVFRSVGRILWPQGIPTKDEEQLIAEDIWQTIRHEMWKANGADPNNWVCSQPALNLSTEPLPVIRKDCGEK